MSSQRAAQLVEAGVWLRLSGDYDGARRLFEQALKVDPANARAKSLLDQPPPPPPTAPPVADEVLPPQDPASPSVFRVQGAQAADPFRRPEKKEGTRATPIELDWGIAIGHPAEIPAPPTAAPHQENAASAAPGPLVERIAPAPDLLSDFQVLAEPPRSAGSAPDDILVEVELEPAHRQAIEFAEGAQSAWDSKSNPGVHLGAIQSQGASALDLLSAPPSPPPLPRQATPREEVRTLLRGAKDLLDLDDHSGAMDLILKAQALAPDDPEVQAMRDNSERVLLVMFESRLGSLSAVPRVKLKEDEIIWLNLDHRAGFVLAQIDGSVSFEDLFSLSGMSRLDTARILSQLVEEGVVSAA